MRRLVPALLLGAALAGAPVACAPDEADAPAALTVSALPPHPGQGSPWFGWSVRPGGEDRPAQRTYRLVIARDLYAVDVVAAGGVHANAWDSGVVHSAQSSDLRPSGFRYDAGTTYYWRVLIQDATGRSSGWSEPQRWTAPR
ncbi:hypothetical protein [Streptomyces sp. SID3343]|uniref:glycoside hydrolase family 78 protein n=1 Tax=Streptomyces sp. SID3343 TaxID=2690260 RepID=UPI00136F4118|nr:hypothetical protein [Streptomyces sp. SID3343]MYW03412.1 hypothetical protein [Streptomyces sp. SID3343]